METRTVKFNLRQFIEDYVFYFESRDQDSKNFLLDNFEDCYETFTLPVRQGIKLFLFNNVISKQYPELQSIATRKEVKI